MKSLYLQYANKKVLVIGASGFIGYNLLQHLSQTSAKVSGISRSFPPNLPKNINYSLVDLIDKPSLLNFIKKKFDIIFHCSGSSERISELRNPLVGYQQNVLGFLNVLDIVQKYSSESKVVLIGSRQEYGKAEYLPVDELHSTRPVDPYSIEKLTASLYARFYNQLHGLDTTVLRLSNVYGPYFPSQRNNHTVLNRFFHLAVQKKPLVIFGNGEQLRDYLYIDDFTSAMLKVGVSPKTKGQTYNVGFGSSIQFKQMIELISEETGTEIVYKEWPMMYQQVETGNYYSNIKKISQEIDWKPEIDFSLGVKKTISFLKEQSTYA